MARDVLDHLGVVVGGQERLALAARRHRQEADEVGQPDVRRRLQLGVLVQEVVELPRLVADPDVERLLAHEVVEDHEVRAQDLVHPADRLERVQVVLAGLAVDVVRPRWRARRSPGGSSRRAPRSTVVTGCCASQWISRPGHLPPQLVGDRDVAPGVAEPDRRRHAQRALASARRSRPRPVVRGGRPPARSANSRSSRLICTGSRAVGAWPDALDRDEARRRSARRRSAPRSNGMIVVVACRGRRSPGT